MRLRGTREREDMSLNSDEALREISKSLKALAEQKEIENMIAFLSTGGLPAMTRGQRTKVETKLIESLLR